MLYRVVIGLYGLVNIAGGLMAFLMPNVRSIWSLIVGGISGILFLVFAAIGGNKPGLAFRGAAGLAFLLALFWVYRITEIVREGKSQMMAVGNLALAMAVVLFLGLGHLVSMRKKTGGH